MFWMKEAGICKIASLISDFDYNVLGKVTRKKRGKN
jgi:hypothetical protein